MLRYYFSRIVGTGSSDDLFRAAADDILESLGDPYVLAADDLRIDVTQPGGWMLVWADVTEAQHAALAVSPDVIYLPFEDVLGNPLGPDTLISTMDVARRDAIRARLETHHVPLDGIALTDPIRRVIARIIRRIRIRRVLRGDDFVELLDAQIRDIPNARRSRINNALLAAGYDTTVFGPSTTIREALRRLIVQGIRMNENGWD